MVKYIAIFAKDEATGKKQLMKLAETLTVKEVKQIFNRGGWGMFLFNDDFFKVFTSVEELKGKIFNELYIKKGVSDEAMVELLSKLVAQEPYNPETDELVHYFGA